MRNIIYFIFTNVHLIMKQLVYHEKLNPTRHPERQGWQAAILDI
jgi:hypothetical protein